MALIAEVEDSGIAGSYLVDDKNQEQVILKDWTELNNYFPDSLKITYREPTQEDLNNEMFIDLRQGMEGRPFAIAGE
jgi:hypothetical protein